MNLNKFFACPAQIVYDELIQASNPIHAFIEVPTRSLQFTHSLRSLQVQIGMSCSLGLTLPKRVGILIGMC